MDMFATIEEFKKVLGNLPERSEDATQKALERQSQLTKPQGSLGRLEELAVWYCGWRGSAKPPLEKSQVIVFAGNHGVAARNVSAFPVEVTEKMVQNFNAGGAAINQLANCFGSKLTVRPLSLDKPTADFTRGPAMSEDEFVNALMAGWEAVDVESDLITVGEMGIGNTTSAAAIAHSLFGGEAADWTGAGTGVKGEDLKRKAGVVALGVRENPAAHGNGLESLRCLGGREIAAMAGAMIKARVERIPVVLDGYICTAAAAALEVASRGALGHAVAGHLSAEGSHPRLLSLINKRPILSLGMRLGEGSGGALAIGTIKAAMACHNGMATFDEADISSR